MTKAAEVSPVKVERTKEEKIEAMIMFAEGDKEYALKSILEHLEGMKYQAERSITELNCRMEAIKKRAENEDEGEGEDKTSIEDYYSWAINEVENGYRNMDFSKAIGNTARFTAAREKGRVIKKMVSETL